jgi:acetyl esterase/lipase
MTIRIRFAVAISCLALFSSQAVSQTMPPDIAAKIAEIGRVIDPPKSNAIYIPLLEKEPYAGVKVTRDVKYGPANLNVLDVFTAEPVGGTPRPVLIHVHGGGFIGGTKKTDGSPLLDNIPLWAARNGMVGVNVNYRLVPEAAWPSGPEDIARVIRWVRENIAAQGGDPNRIYLLGWSAGGSHVASYVAFPQFHAAPNGGLAGAILVSAMPMDLTAPDAMAPPGNRAYLGEDRTKWAERSALPGLLKASIPPDGGPCRI